MQCLIYICTVCLMPIKRARSLYRLNGNILDILIQSETHLQYQIWIIYLYNDLCRFALLCNYVYSANSDELYQEWVDSILKRKLF